MPHKRRINGQWSELHRRQLREGADNTGQLFGVNGIRSRRRDALTGPDLDPETIARNWNRAGKDFAPETMALAEAAWLDLRDELLAEAGDHPEEIWAYCRFEQQATNRN